MAGRTRRGVVGEEVLYNVEGHNILGIVIECKLYRVVSGEKCVETARLESGLRVRRSMY